MSIATFTKTGTKATTPVTLDKKVFGEKVENHDLLHRAYVAHLANKRQNLAITKTRGLVRGGGRKPWRQKGTGRARFGSSRNPIWRGGGIVFGPTGNENYTIKLTTADKRKALRQALSIAAHANSLKVIETFECKDGKVAPAVKLLNKLEATGNVLLIVSEKDDLVKRATNNVAGLKVADARYLSVFDILNAENIVITKKSLEIISGHLATRIVKKAEAKV